MKKNSNPSLQKEDYYFENGLMVFTEVYHLKRGSVAKAVVGIVLMDLKKKITVSWSGGKDSAFALYKILASGKYSVQHLHTVFNDETKRVGLHGVPEALIEKQAKALGLKLIKLYLPASEDHDAYEKLMLSFYQACAEEKIEEVLFGDIFLEDLKSYREKLLVKSGLQGLFPIWGVDSRSLINDFINSGFKTVICAANTKYFDPTDLGTTLDAKFIENLASSVDPCGENGEFHTFVYGGPLFSNAINFHSGEVLEKKYSYKVKQNNGSVLNHESSFWFKELS